jgi:hypothetical protein
MRSLRKCLRGALVWMTAASVLLAGFPHYQCRCPDGTLKLLCFGWAAGKDCCCAGSCCPTQTARAAAVKPAKKACCCCHGHSGPDGKQADTAARVANPGCQKTVLAADFAAVATTPKVAPDGPLAAPYLLPPTHLLALPAPDMGPNPLTRDCSRPPPTDLVILHQHFVI